MTLTLLLWWCYYAGLLLLPVLVVSTSSSSSGWTFYPHTTAVVTGGTKGIGRAIVEELLSHGCRVLTCSRNQTELDELLEKYNPSSSSSSCCCLYGVVANVATPEGRATLIHAIREYLGPKLDILVNNVGTNIRKASIDYDNEDVQHIWNTNFHSMFALTTACHSFLKRSSCCSSGDTTQTSSVVNIGSVAGVTCLKTGTPYAATKAAMNQITGNWACEWGPDGIRVNCVTPWYINTQLAKQVLKNKDYKRYTISLL
jgi:Tropinone reductase 1